MTLFEFSTEKSVRNWYALDDTVMGGVSQSQMRYAGEGGARFHGELSLEQGGGFASVRYDKTSFDLSAFAGIDLRVKGDGHHYQLRLGNPATRVAYAQTFGTTEGWTTIHLPFGDFSPTFRGRDVPDAPALERSSITEVTFMLADKQAGSFALLIDWVKAV